MIMFGIEKTNTTKTVQCELERSSFTRHCVTWPSNKHQHTQNVKTLTQ